MPVQHWTYNIEFQARGAAHVHRVLWLNMNVMENYCQKKNGELVTVMQIDKLPELKEKLQQEEDIKTLKKNKPFKNLKEAYEK